MKVLICEDDPVPAAVIKLALKRDGIEVVHVSDGRKAMELLRTSIFDLIITDIHLPYHNGDEILTLVRVEQGKKVPIIMVSSDTEEEVINLALKSGVNEFVKKPLQHAQMEKVLKKYL